MQIACIVGTRPEAIKMAPILLAARGHPRLKLRLVATGQHDALFDAAVAAFGITADEELGAARPEPLDRLINRILAALKANAPDLVLVQGDTNSARAGAEAAHALGIPIGHVEAGLRTHNLQRPYPEEQNRVAIAQLAMLHFAPANSAADNLIAEGIDQGVHVTGNPGIDALMILQSRLAQRVVATGPKHILVTCHRRENFGAPLKRICAALKTLTARGDVRITLPLHPNPEVRVPLTELLAADPHINIIEPLEYPAMIAAIRTSHCVLSDSGGVQEECAALGVPLLLLREETERVELIASGNVQLVGSDEGQILHATSALLDDAACHAAMSMPYFPYGQGDAATKIIAVLEDYALSR